MDITVQLDITAGLTVLMALAAGGVGRGAEAVGGTDRAAPIGGSAAGDHYIFARLTLGVTLTINLVELEADAAALTGRALTIVVSVTTDRHILTWQARRAFDASGRGVAVVVPIALGTRLCLAVAAGTIRSRIAGLAYQLIAILLHGAGGAGGWWQAAFFVLSTRARARGAGFATPIQCVAGRIRHERARRAVAPHHAAVGVIFGAEAAALARAADAIG